MSALGHKRTLKRFRMMSALPPKADITGRHEDVRERGAQTSHFRSQFLDLDQIQICRRQTTLQFAVKGQFLQPKGISTLTAF
jgi:hypothetical protein